MSQYSIREYVAWLTLIPLLIITVSLEAYFLHEHFLDSNQNLLERGQLVARQLASSSEYGVFSNNLPFLQNIAQDVLLQPDVQGVIILDADGNVLIEAGEFPAMPDAATHEPSGSVKQSVGMLMPVRHSSTGLRVYQAIVPAQVMLEELDVQPQIQAIGAVIVEMSNARTEQHKAQMIWLTVGFTALFLIFPFSLIYLGSRGITTPIRKLSDAVRAIGAGSLETRAAVSAPVAELLTLIKGINEMAANLQQEQAMLQQRTARLTEAQRIAHLGNWEWDIVDNRLTGSDEIYRIFALDPLQFGSTYEAFLQTVHPEDRQLLVDRVREVLEQGDAFSLDHRIVLPDGSLRYVHEQAEVVRNDAGLPVKMLGTLQDITEAKLTEERIHRLNEELEEKVQRRTQQLLDAQDELVRKEKLAVLGQVAGSVGHELRNPLGVMSNAVYFLQTVLADSDETTKEYLNIINSEIAGAERIVADLLDSVRTKPPHPQLVSLAELVRQTLGKLAIPANVSVRTDIPADLPALRVDALQIHQVLRNLVSNAVEAMPDGGVLEIAASANDADRTVTIRVRDSGEGMAPEHLAKLFQPLFTTKARGIGLGLVVVKNLTQANGGTVKVESADGKGALFSITLPCEPNVEDAVL